MALYVTRPRRDEVRIGRGFPSEWKLPKTSERFGRNDLNGVYGTERFENETERFGDGTKRFENETKRFGNKRNTLRTERF